MSKKAMFLWCLIGIGVFVGLYVVVWARLPMAAYPWAAFVSLPMCFMSGAALKDMPKQIVCSASGVLWGDLCILLLTKLAIPGLGGAVNLFVWVTIVVALTSYVHMQILGPNVLKGIFSNCPMVFGGFACCFALGISTTLGLIITLAAGCLMAWLIIVLQGVFSKIDVPARK